MATLKNRRAARGDFLVSLYTHTHTRIHRMVDKKMKTTTKAKAKASNQIVCYTGMGAKRSGIHTEAEFLKGVRRLCPSKSPKCPAEGDVQAWVDWSGAMRRTPTQCKRTMKHNAKIGVAFKAHNRAIDTFDTCVTKRASAKCGKSFDDRPVPQEYFARCAVKTCPEVAVALAKSELRLRKMTAASMRISGEIKAKEKKKKKKRSTV